MSHSLAALPAGSQVLVVGAGPGGAALARALLSFGVEVDVVEKRSAFSASDGAGILLPGNAAAMLDALGHLDAVRARACEIPAVQLTSPDGKPLGRVACDDLAYPTLGIRYAYLRETLLADVPVKFGVTVESLHEDGKVTVCCSDGSERQYDLVVGADGVHSVLRDVSFGEQPADIFAQYSGYRFVVDSDLGLDTATTYLGDGLTLLFVPLAGHQTYCGAGPVHADKRVDADTVAETIARTYQAFPAVAEALQACSADTAFIPSQFWQVNTPVWHTERTVLIGDAAHATAPTLSQGAAMALEDVAVLLAELKSCTNIAAALANYQQRREPRVRFVQEESRRRILANETTDARAGRLQRFSSAAFGAGAIHQIWSGLLADEVVTSKELR